MIGHAATSTRSAWLKLFPPPDFLTMPLVGVDVSDRSVKFVELERGSRGILPKRFDSYDIPAGIVEDGEVRSQDGLCAVLERLRREQDLGLVHASLPEQQAYVFQTQVPAAQDETQLTQMVEFKLEENVPHEPREVILGYDVLGPAEDASQLLVTAVAYPRDKVARYVGAFEGAGLTPISLEIESQAIARAVVGEDDPETHLIVDFGETRTGLAIVAMGRLAFTSTLEVPGKQITDAVKEHRTAEENEVVRIKNEEGIQVGSSALRESLMEVIERFADGIEKHFRYWNSKAKTSESARPIRRIVLCGGNACLSGLPEYLVARLGVDVRRANVWKNALSFDEAIPQMPLGMSLSYAPAIGLALRGK